MPSPYCFPWAKICKQCCQWSSLTWTSTSKIMQYTHLQSLLCRNRKIDKIYMLYYFQALTEGWKQGTGVGGVSHLNIKPLSHHHRNSHYVLVLLLSFYYDWQEFPLYFHSVDHPIFILEIPCPERRYYIEMSHGTSAIMVWIYRWYYREIPVTETELFKLSTIIPLSRHTLQQWMGPR